jgi:hypothetical protein
MKYFYIVEIKPVDGDDNAFNYYCKNQKHYDRIIRKILKTNGSVDSSEDLTSKLSVIDTEVSLIVKHVRFTTKCKIFDNQTREVTCDILVRKRFFDK